MKLFIEQEGSAQAEVLFDQLSTQLDTELYVPELFIAECASVLWQYVRRASYPANQAKINLARLRALSLQKVDSQEVVSKALEIAIAHNISAYDACYVELSKRLQLSLVTADQKLIHALAGTTYQIQALMG
ncbi:MAG: type II toxin-antitoxin system VapC family toxin [Tildeniella torsiva UHER 1998/13D]|jgi:predicted nucleic acid-binding protein|nr:type II toxin-antitoxin system VapC family toxin [Tildeniella torsiva UHER 1998/13D]